MTTALAWTAVVAACVAAALFGQTSRTGPARRSRRVPPSTRIGMVVSMTGPWVALLLAAAGGVLTGQGLVAAAAGLAGVVVVALVGLLLAPG